MCVAKAGMEVREQLAGIVLAPTMWTLEIQLKSSGLAAAIFIQ